jgi:hypothetical protein
MLVIIPINFVIPYIKRKSSLCISQIIGVLIGLSFIFIDSSLMEILMACLERACNRFSIVLYQIWMQE